MDWLLGGLHSTQHAGCIDGEDDVVRAMRTKSCSAARAGPVLQPAQRTIRSTAKETKQSRCASGSQWLTVEFSGDDVLKRRAIGPWRQMGRRRRVRSGGLPLPVSLAKRAFLRPAGPARCTEKPLVFLEPFEGACFGRANRHYTREEDGRNYVFTQAAQARIQEGLMGGIRSA